MIEKYRESGRKKHIGGKKREGRTLDCHVKKANIKGKDNRAFDPWLNRALRKSLLYVRFLRQLPNSIQNHFTH